MTVATVADLLREIHRLRRHARDLQAELERGPRQLQIQKNKIGHAEETFRQAQETLKKLKIANNEREVSLKTTNAVIAKHERQLNEAASKKEYDALRSEITAERTKCGQLEDEILNGLMEIDEKSTQLPELEKGIQRAKSEFAEFERTFATRQAERTEMLQQTRRQLAEVETGLPLDVRPQFERLLGQRGEDALAKVEGTTCTACYTGITAQNMNELRQGLFVVCKSCGRILYLAD